MPLITINVASTCLPFGYIEDGSFWNARLGFVEDLNVYPLDTPRVAAKCAHRSHLDARPSRIACATHTA